MTWDNLTDVSGYKPLKIETLEVRGLRWAFQAMRNPRMNHERSTPEDDIKLASKLVRAGDSDGKFTRGIVVWAEMDCQIGWFVEWATYRVGVEVLSTSSTMVMDLKGMKGPDLAAAKQAGLPDVVYHQTFMASYQALRRIYQQRRNHRHPDWQIYCKWIEKLPYAQELILP